jgi:prepilin-type N-terminal cleavage/methylation domain-containing protein
MLKRHSGFTLLEMLTVLSVIALLISATLIMSGSIRRANRDSKRVSDVSSLRLALLEYQRLSGTYPVALVAGQPLKVGDNILLSSIPGNPQPVDGDCPQAEHYVYLRSADGSDYTLSFCLSARSGDWGPGVNSLSAESDSTCLPDCVLSCKNGSDGCGGVCANIIECSAGSTCLNDHCVRD